MKQYLILSMIFIMSINIISCKNNEKPFDTKGEYYLRVKNIFNLVDSINYIIPSENCSIYIIPIGDCNVCNKEALASIIQKEKISKNPKLFILNGYDKSVVEDINMNLIDNKNKINIYVDTIGFTKKVGLYFYKNLKIEFQAKKITNWEFI